LDLDPHCPDHSQQLTFPAHFFSANHRVSERYGRQIRFYEIHTLELVFVGVILLVTSALGIVGTYQAIKTIVQNASTYTFF
jgi:hypothetical protein